MGAPEKDESAGASEPTGDVNVAGDAVINQAPDGGGIDEAAASEGSSEAGASDGEASS